MDEQQKYIRHYSRYLAETEISIFSAHGPYDIFTQMNKRI